MLACRVATSQPVARVNDKSWMYLIDLGVLWWTVNTVCIALVGSRMTTSSNGNIFQATSSLCAGNSPVTGEFPAQRPVTQSLGVFFDLHLNKRLSKQSWGWWLSGVPDLFDRNKILSGGDLSHYQVPHCIRVFFYFVWFVFIHHNFQFYFELCTYCNILDIHLS